MFEVEDLLNFDAIGAGICSYKERRDEVKKMREAPSENDIL